MDEPRYGYGKAGRPLWSPRDRDAEAVRRVLRRAGLRDFDERHPNGFAVEGAGDSEDGPEPFSVAYCGHPESPATLRRYVQVLERAGFDVSADPLDEGVLLVQRQPAGRARLERRPGQTLLTVAIICAVLATVALLISWIGAGQVRLAGGISSGLLAPLAAFLGGAWYRRQLDEPWPSDQ